MKKFYVAIIVIIATLGFFFWRAGDRGLDRATVCFGGDCVSVEVANTPFSRARGLMERESLEPDAGMLFVFESEGEHPFWMKNTLIPLDIIWVDEEHTIVHIANAIPCGKDPCPTYNPGEKAKYVVEVNAGYTSQKNIKVGDRITIE
jgi:uncharacterized protein